MLGSKQFLFFILFYNIGFTHFIYRQILERAISQKIPMKKMRTLFKKYLDFEERFGDGEAIQKVKSLAAQYVDAELKA